MQEYPEFAWQEAIVNAVAHRDYEDQAREIEVWFLEDRMEVKSPGDLVPPVTVDLLRSRTPVHASRNPLIVRVLAEVGLMREEGEGIARMFEEMEACYLNGPEFALDASTFTVTLRNEPIFTGVNAEWLATVRKLPLSVAQKRVLAAHPDGFTNEDYRRLNSVDRDQAYHAIQEMVRLGVVLRAQAVGRGAMYRVAPEIAAKVAGENGANENAKNALSAAHISSKSAWRLSALSVHFERQAFVTNAQYRRLFNLGRDTAKRELVSLVRQGYLRPEGRGRGARYVTGPKFPAEGTK
jgi:ATP-dependent DNA helicase RecG